MNHFTGKLQTASGAIWSAAGNAMYAFSSVILLVTVNRNNPIAITGSFSFAYTFAQMLLFLGLFGVSTLQMTDYEERYSFYDYLWLRGASIAGMLVIGIAAGAIAGPENGKAILIILLTIYMGIQAFADLYQSRFMQMNQLRLYGQAQFFRMLLSAGAFALCATLWKTPVIASLCMIVINCITTAIWCVQRGRRFCLPTNTASVRNIKQLARESLPLCVGLFLISFIVNCSKYFINLQLDDEIQGYFNLIFMPTYMITLVSQFLFLPMLKRYHSIVSTGDRRMIKSLLMRNIGYLAVLTLAASIGIYYLGPLLLGIIYQTELSQFRVEMLIVMLGGGFFAVYQFYYYLFVILKKQKIVLRNLIYGTLFVVPLTYVFIHWFGMIGACAAYTITLLLLALLFATSFHTALIKSGDGDSSKRAVECAEEVGERIKQDLVI